MSKRFAFCLLAVAGLLVLLNLSPRAAHVVRGTLGQAVGGLSVATASAMESLRSTVVSFCGADLTLEERCRLEQEIARLRLELAAAQQAPDENAYLRRLLRFKATSAFVLTTATVIGRGEATGWWRTLRLDCGREDGLQPGQAVLSTDGLVGKVTNAGPHQADVLLITDPQSAVTCQVVRTGALAILRAPASARLGRSYWEVGADTPQWCLQSLSGALELVTGDELITAGTGLVYPAGIRVGTVVEVLPPDRDRDRGVPIEFQPAADLAHVRHVFAIQDVRRDALGRPLDPLTLPPVPLVPNVFCSDRGSPETCEPPQRHGRR